MVVGGDVSADRARAARRRLTTRPFVAPRLALAVRCAREDRQGEELEELRELEGHRCAWHLRPGRDVPAAKKLQVPVS